MDIYGEGVEPDEYHLFKSSNCTFSNLTQDSRMNVGYYLDGENLHSLQYYDSETTGKELVTDNDITFESIYPHWDTFASSDYEQTTENTFTVEESVNEEQINSFAYYLACINWDVSMATSFTITLGEDGKVPQIDFFCKYYIGPVVLNITSYNSCTLPFVFEDLPLISA